MGEYDRWKTGPQLPPQPGEVVVGCGHTARAPISRYRPDPKNHWTWLEVIPPVEVAHPTERGNLAARWVVVCQICRAAAGGDVRRCQLREHWTMPDSVTDHMGAIRSLGADRAAVRRYLEQLGAQELRAVCRRLGIAP